MNFFSNNQLLHGCLLFLLASVSAHASSDQTDKWSTKGNFSEFDVDLNNCDHDIERCSTPLAYPERAINPLAHTEGLLQKIACDNSEYGEYIRNVLFNKHHPLHYEEIKTGFEKHLPRNAAMLELSIQYLLFTRPSEIDDLLELDLASSALRVILQHAESEHAQKQLLRFIKKTDSQKIYNVLTAITPLNEAGEFLRQDLAYVYVLNNRLHRLIIRNINADFCDKRKYLGSLHSLCKDVVDIIFSYLVEEQDESPTKLTCTAKSMIDLGFQEGDDDMHLHTLVGAPRLLMFN